MNLHQGLMCTIYTKVHHKYCEESSQKIMLMGNAITKKFPAEIS